jgi:hypothetical protein
MDLLSGFRGLSSMTLPVNPAIDAFDPRFKIFDELMPTEVSEMFLVSTPSDVCMTDHRFSREAIRFDLQL